MKTRITYGLLLLAAFTLALIGCRPPPCVNFESPLSIGETYGRPAGQRIGDLAFIEDNIHVTVDNFYTRGQTVYFEYAEILSPPSGFGSGQSIHATNINLRFDFSSLGYPVTRASFQYQDMGGLVNLATDDVAFRGELSEYAGSLGLASVEVTSTLVDGGERGTVVLTGAMDGIIIGGENIWIDDVCPSP